MGSIFQALGITRDGVSAIVAKWTAFILALAAMGGGATAVGIPASWVPYIALVAMFVSVSAAQHSSRGDGSGGKVAAPALLLAMIAGSVLILPACGVFHPKAGQPSVFSPDALIGDISILTRITTALNQEPGTLHISDEDEAKIEHFANVATAALKAYQSGAGTLESAKVAVDLLNLPLGPAAAARAAFDQAVIDHGAGASSLAILRDAYIAMYQGLSIDAQAHPVLVATLQVVNGVISAIKL